MARSPRVPKLCQVAIEADDVRALAEFYRLLLDLVYRSGDDPPTDGPDNVDWLVLLHRDGSRAIAIQESRGHRRSTWPDLAVPQQMHLDMTVNSVAELEEQRQRALALGAVELLDSSHDPNEPLYVFADVAGHPFCIFVAPDQGPDS